MTISKQRAVAMRQILHEAFPLAIMAQGAIKTPLKIGIHQDILERMPELSKTRVREALRDYVNGPKYLRQCVVGAWRIDLDGNPTTQIDEACAAGDAARLAGLRRLWAKKRGRTAKPVDQTNTTKDLAA